MCLRLGLSGGSVNVQESSGVAFPFRPLRLDVIVVLGARLLVRETESSPQLLHDNGSFPARLCATELFDLRVGDEAKMISVVPPSHCVGLCRMMPLPSRLRDEYYSRI